MKSNKPNPLKHRNPGVEAMRKRGRRVQAMQHRANKRAKDVRNHWSKEVWQ